jgi:hypothetical protein
MSEIIVSPVPDVCTTRNALFGIYTERYNHKKSEHVYMEAWKKKPLHLPGGGEQPSGHSAYDIDAITTMQF